MESITIIFIGFIVVIVFDSIGSILSRLLKFNYTWLTLGSILIYGSIGLLVAKNEGTLFALLACFLLGVIDSTVGLFISKKLKAYTPGVDLEDMDISFKFSVLMGALALGIGLISISLFL